jgi:DNA processing protein
MTRREAYIALNMIGSLGPVRVRNLVSALGSPEAVLEAGEEDLRRAEGIGAEVARGIVAQRGAADPAAEEARARKHGARIITCEEPEYPAALQAIYDPPLVLYVRGTLDPKDKHAVAVVGTRHATHYGLSMADRLAYQLAKTSFTVVSGLARGIDTAAHRAALKGGGRTLAVLGSALDKLYPEENAGLADEIAQQGAVISEYTMGREPDRTTFPYRNRVVSGLSMGIVVVEAGSRAAP